MTHRRTVLSLATAGLALLAACADTGQPTESAARQAPGQPSAKIDAEALARAIPSFGGVFLNAEKAPVVYLVNPAERSLAEQELAGYLSSRGLAKAALQVREAQFTYRQLGTLHERISPEALDKAGVIFTDLDEANNRVTIGVENEAAEVVVRDVARRLGIPLGAVRFQKADPIHYAVGLRDVVRPVQGGLQIHFGNYLCTLGFNATSGTTASFITNSHCTNTQGGTEGTVYYQPTSSLSAAIATEAADPVYVKGGTCAKGKKCRRSDASRAAYNAGAVFALGTIARTESRGNLTGSITISATNPAFTITGEDGSQVVGEEVNKVGRTTGWTYGNVTNTCVNTSVSGSQVLLLCQNFVAGGVGGGDSGSPVFSWNGASGATLTGILWGGNSAGNQFVYSPITNIEQELGALTTF